jgi:hypothetical protein
MEEQNKIKTHIFHEENIVKLKEEINNFYRDNQNIQIISTTSAPLGKGLSFFLSYTINENKKEIL